MQAPIEAYQANALARVCRIRKLKGIAVSSAGTRSVNFVLVNGNYKKWKINKNANSK